jgi:hypothetical protein
MDPALFAHAREKFEHEVRTRLDGAPIASVELQQFGDAPEIEPGQLLGKIFITLPEGADPDDMATRRQAFSAFMKEYRPALSGLRKALGATAIGGGLNDLNFPNSTLASDRGPVTHMTLKESRLRALGLGLDLAAGGDQSLTAVMARLGPEDLETLDTLIAVGIASSRAEAVRWALARIRERPAYEQIRARSREIEDLKSQF